MMSQRGNRGSLTRMALVGYTNVGKSTILNLLAKTEVFAENKLFATLDTTVRKVVVDNIPFLLSDTVGFIRKLPTQLVESFKSTLDEVRESDVLVHVVDVSHPNFEEMMHVVQNTLRDIGCADKPVYLVFNKIDVFKERRTPDGEFSLDSLKKTWISKLHDPCIFISAKEKINIDKFRRDLYGMAAEVQDGRYPFGTFLW